MIRWTYNHVPRGCYHGYRCAICVHFPACSIQFGSIADSNYCHRRPAAFERKAVLTPQDMIGQLQSQMWKLAGKPGKNAEFIRINREIARLAGLGKGSK